MNREFTIRTDESGSYAVYNKDDNYIEAPYHNNDDIKLVQDNIDSALTESALYNVYNQNHNKTRMDVYVNGDIVRKDYNIVLPEGVTILEELESAFPEYINFNRSELNIVGKYDPYREPYQNPSISWYDIGNYPSEALQLNFKTSYLNDDLINWYGLKFDLVTNEVLLKIVTERYYGPQPVLPVGNTFYAITHSVDGSVGDWVDAYVYATPKRIKEFCTTHELDYPLQPTTHLECDVIWCWGVVFNKNTLEYGSIKAYARYNIN